MEKLNPSNPQQKSAAERKRIPMSTPVQKLEVPDMPGYHLHWFNGTADRIQRAIDGGYEFVDPRDVKINSVNLGGDSVISGNTDMGSRVSVVGGSELGKDGQPVRLVLMRIKQEWWEEDQRTVEARNEQVAAALRGGLIGAGQDAPGDTQQRYIDKARTSVPDMFNPNKKRKSAS